MTDQTQRFNVGPGGSLDLDNVFSYHPPFGDQVGRYEEIRSYGKDLAVSIEQSCPPGPERSTALAKVREAVMWANAAIACNEKDPSKICTCSEEFKQEESIDPSCPAHGFSVMHWVDHGAMVHAVEDVLTVRATDTPAKVTCGICKTHLPQAAKPERSSHEQAE